MISTVYILIPAHNNKREVLEVLCCLNRQSYKNIKIILVDDGSTDNTEVEAKDSFPDTIILKGDGNLWWTGANVIGVGFIMKIAKKGDFILLLNNDLTIESDYIETIVNASNLQGRAITGSLLVDYSNREFIESGVRLNAQLDLIVNRDKNLILNTDIDIDVDVLPGRGTLIPVEVFKRIGNFNQKKLPHYGADYEFSIRAKRAGYKLIVSNKAIVFGQLDITGLEVPDKKFISLKECGDLLFSKKSKTNIFYYLNYVWLCSEKNYRLKNLLCNARGILSKTIGKTVPCYPFKIVYTVTFYPLKIALFMFLNIYRFLFNGYPLRAKDLEQYGLNNGKLVKEKMLLKHHLNGRNVDYYRINNKAISFFENLLPDERVRFSRLMRHSFSYKHKLTIILEKFNYLIHKDAIK